MEMPFKKKCEENTGIFRVRWFIQEKPACIIEKVIRHSADLLPHLYDSLKSGESVAA